jgi:ribosome-interacting GTPase 1
LAIAALPSLLFRVGEFVLVLLSGGEKEITKMGILEKIKDIELEMARTQKNKATEHHMGMLKCKLAKLRAQLLDPGKSASGKGEGFEVLKSGDARVALIG